MRKVLERLVVRITLVNVIVTIGTVVINVNDVTLDILVMTVGNVK